METIVNRLDLIYRLIGLAQAVGLGMTTLLSLKATAATTNWLASAMHVDKNLIGLIALAFGLAVTFRRWRFIDFFILMLPLIIYAIANLRYVAIAQLSPTVPSLLLFFSVIIMLVVRYGFKPLR